MEPIFIRMQKMIPSSTNHVERFHRFVNESIDDLQNPYKKLGTLFKCMESQMNNYNDNLLRNLKEYIKNLRDRAKEIVENDPDRLEDYSKDDCDEEFVSM